MDKIVTKHSSKSSKLQKDKHDLDLPYSLVHATHPEQIPFDGSACRRHCIDQSHHSLPHVLQKKGAAQQV